MADLVEFKELHARFLLLNPLATPVINIELGATAAIAGKDIIGHIFLPSKDFQINLDPKETITIGRLAVRSGIWPLKEYINGQTVHTKIPRERKSVEDYLKLQGRFKHLFEPQRNDSLLGEIQHRVDQYWQQVEEK